MAQRETERAEYTYLIARPHPWRKQLSLRGRNMTVGQLVATIRANGLSPAEASDNLDVPLAQIEEALAYYATHRALVDAELRDEKRRLQAKGYAIEPPAISRL